MTPNPNPSPEDEKLAEDAYSDGYEFFRNKWIGDHVEMNADLVRHFVPRALSPQTLPAPGEVERLRSAIQALRGTLQCIANEEGDTVLGRRCIAAIGKSRVPQSPTLATGVAEQAAQFADGVAEGAQSLYDLAVRDRDTVGTLIHGEAVRVAKHIAAAIRLLPQGGGK